MELFLGVIFIYTLINLFIRPKVVLSIFALLGYISVLLTGVILLGEHVQFSDGAMLAISLSIIFGGLYLAAYLLDIVHKHKDKTCPETQ